MPSTPVYRDPQGTRYTVDRTTGAWRELTDGDFERMIPGKVLDEMGVDWDERFTFKNFAANPQTALAFLQSLTNDDGSKKYEVMPYGDGLNFATRRLNPDGTPAEEDFRLADPRKGGVGEFFRDVADLLVGDIALPTAGAVGGALALGGTTGGVAAAPGVAAGTALAETARQGIGTALGIPENIDLTQAAVTGAVGGVAQVALAGTGAMIGKAVRKGAGALASGLRQSTATSRGGVISRASAEFAKRMTGIAEGEDLSITEILLETAARKGVPAKTPATMVNIVQQHLGAVAPRHISNLTTQRNALIAADSVVDLRKFAKPLAELTDIVTTERTFSFGESMVEQELKQMAKGLLNAPTMESVTRSLPSGTSPEALKLAFKGAVMKWEEGLARVPTRVALYMKNRLQAEAASGGGFAGIGAAVPQSTERVTPKFVHDLTKFSRSMNIGIKRQLPADVTRLDRQISATIIAREGLAAKMGAEAANPEMFIKNALNKAGSPIRRVMESYNKVFPELRLLRMARETAVALRMTPVVTSEAAFGLPPAVPQIAARAGLPIGFTAIGGATLGGLTVGPAGAVAGGVAGIAAASPANIVRTAPGMIARAARVQRAAQRLSQAGEMLGGRILRSGAAVPLATTAASRVFGKNVAKQDKKKKRVAFFMGS